MSFKTLTEQQLIIAEIKKYMMSIGGKYSEWYCGIASDPKERLFNDHNVNEQVGAWIHSDCGSERVARTLEQHFLKLGCRGGSGGGDESMRFIYAYKITVTTVE